MPSTRVRARRERAASRRSIRSAVATLLVVGFASACSSTGDTGDLLLEGAQACSTVCTTHPDIDAFSYRAGGGVPLLFLGTVEASCRCADPARGEARGEVPPMSRLQDAPS